MKIYQAFLFALFPIIIGCASTYKPIQPDMLQYGGETTLDSITFKYKYNVLGEKGNKKYSKKEKKKGFNLVAIQVINNSSSSLNLNQQVDLLCEGNNITPLQLSIAGRKLRQRAETYLLYSLLVISYTTGRLVGNSAGGISVQTTTNYYPVGLPIGLVNFFVALYANKKFRNELQTYDIWDKTIAPHQTLNGLVLMERQNLETLNIGWKPKK